MQHVCGICKGYPGEVNDSRGPAGIPEIRLPTLFGKPRTSELHPEPEYFMKALPQGVLSVLFQGLDSFFEKGRLVPSSGERNLRQADIRARLAPSAHRISNRDAPRLAALAPGAAAGAPCPGRCPIL